MKTLRHTITFFAAASCLLMSLSYASTDSSSLVLAEVQSNQVVFEEYLTLGVLPEEIISTIEARDLNAQILESTQRFIDYSGFSEEEARMLKVNAQEWPELIGQFRPFLSS